jgi:hypothetical protein
VVFLHNIYSSCSYNSWLNAEILLFAIKNPIKKIFRNIWTQKKKEEKKKNDKQNFFIKKLDPAGTRSQFLLRHSLTQSHCATGTSWLERRNIWNLEDTNEID